MARSSKENHVLDNTSAFGVDVEDVFRVLEHDGVANFGTSWRQLLASYPGPHTSAARRNFR